MHMVWKSVTEDEFFRLVEEDADLAKFMEDRLRSYNKALEEKLSNLDNLKSIVGVSYKNDKMKLFVGDT